MKKIYIVTQGQYSDYKILGVFDKEELANKFITSGGKYEYNYPEIEEWELNPNAKELRRGYLPFTVGINRDGRVVSVTQKSLESNKGWYGNDTIIYNPCFAKDRDHAIKITSELRTRLLANNEW